MRRTAKAALLFLVLCAPAHAQGDDLKALSEENRQLRLKVDSLQRVVAHIASRQKAEESPISSWGTPASAGHVTETPSVISAWDRLEDFGEEDIREDVQEEPGKESATAAFPFTGLVDKYIRIYTKDRARQMPSILGRYEKYNGMFREEFRKAGVPEEYTALAIVESGMSPKARSSAGAVGMWQFMPDAARGYGMKITYDIDERMDVEKSTRGAAAFIRNAYGMLGDWQLAICSYNCGIGRVQKAIRTAGSKRYEDIFDYLPAETREYLPALMAAMKVASAPQEYGLTVRPYHKEAYITRVLGTDTTAKDVAEALGCTEEEITRLNPPLRHGTIPAGYRFRIPARFDKR